MNPGDRRFARCLMRGLAWAKANPDGRLKLDWATTIAASELPRFVRDKVHHAISARGGEPESRGRKDRDDYQMRLRRDQRAIRDYRLSRIVRRGSGLESAEGRRLAPDVHEAMRDRDG